MSCIFVGGINRSGTTLLQSILCSDSTTNPMIHEASYVRSIVDAYVSGLQKFDEHGKYYFSSVNDLLDFTAQWLKSFLKKTRLRYPGTENLVLKHPPLTPRFPELFRLLKAAGEDPHFFILVRDPRDVVASLVKVGERLREKGESEGATLPRDMLTLGNYYQQCYKPALISQDQEYQKSITLIKYEDMVTNPDQVIDTIKSASSLSLDRFNAGHGWSDSEVDYNDLKGKSNAWLSDLWGQKLSASRIGNYRNILTVEEIKILEQICAGPLKTFAYN